ncbi:hypothetical protein ES703_95748 [subsurface metagenome]
MTKDCSEYMVSAQGNFKVVDTIGIPHPYMIGAKHVGHAADHHCGMLGKEAIIAGEKQGITCAMKGCTLTYEEHEQALLIGCKVEIKDNNEELHDYLLGLKDLAGDNGFAGFAFLKQF